MIVLMMIAERRMEESSMESIIQSHVLCAGLFFKVLRQTTAIPEVILTLVKQPMIGVMFPILIDKIESLPTLTCQHLTTLM